MSDSRISGGANILTDEGAKLFSLPVVCRRPDADGFFSVPYFIRDFGVGCVGSTLGYQNIYAFLVASLSNLVGDGKHVPSLGDIAAMAARVATAYVRSVGQHNRLAHRLELVVAGQCPATGPSAYAVVPRLENDCIHFRADEVALDGGRAHFIGDCTQKADEALLAARAGESEASIGWHRAPARVVREFIEDPELPTIGGDAQIGLTVGARFVRMGTVSPIVEGQPAAVMRLNNIDILAAGNVGPCAIGIDGMAGI
ncbi:MAG: hypothetical protein AB7V62_04445 [Thermoleophilia bacterium]